MQIWLIGTGLTSEVGQYEEVLNRIQRQGERRTQNHSSEPPAAAGGTVSGGEDRCHASGDQGGDEDESSPSTPHQHGALPASNASPNSESAALRLTESNTEFTSEEDGHRAREIYPRIDKRLPYDQNAGRAEEGSGERVHTRATKVGRAPLDSRDEFGPSPKGGENGTRESFTSAHTPREAVEVSSRP